jgi:serine protease Do
MDDQPSVFDMNTLTVTRNEVPDVGRYSHIDIKGSVANWGEIAGDNFLPGAASMPQPGPESGFLAVLPRVKSATALIGMAPERLDGHLTGMGTGFFVAEAGLVLTSNHVVESHLKTKMAQWLRVWLPTLPKPAPCRIAGYLSDPLHDLCLLRVDGDGSLPAPLPIGWDHQIREGEEVALCGYPYGFTNLFNRGKPGLRGINSVAQRAIVSAIWPCQSSRGSEVALMQLDALTNPGNSGSPVFLPSTGEVIGVLSGFLRNGSDGQVLNTGISEAIPIHCLHNLMRRWEARRE